MHEKLTKYFIGFSISEYDYERVYRMLPTPSLESYQYSDGGTMRKKIIIYILDNYIVSAKQFKWIASIKHAIKIRIRCDIKWIDEYFLGDDTIVNILSYDLQYLSDLFDAKRIVYPIPLYPDTPKAIYRNLCFIAQKLHKKNILYKELLLSIAINFNSKFTKTQQLKHRKLYAKVLRCIQFINEQNPTSLKGNELKKAHKRGGEIRAKQLQNEKDENLELLIKLLKEPCYYKKNGKLNIMLLTKKMGKTRQTVYNYLRELNL